jgi:hypothetical protein
MRNRDCAYRREPAAPRDRQYPPPPGGEGGPRGPAGPPGQARPDRPGEAGWPGSEGYQADDGEPYDPRAAPYPLTYEHHAFDGRPTWSTGPERSAPPQAGPWQADPRRAGSRPTSPGRAMPQRPAPEQAAPRQASCRQAGLRRGTSRPAPPRPTAPPPAGQFGGDQYIGGQRGYAGGQPRYAHGQRDYPACSAEPWSPGYSSGRQGSAEPMRSLYPDSQAGEEPWLDDSRGPRLDGPWWDPDSWPGWRRWLIPVGVAVLAAAIGAALVLLTGTHPGVSAGLALS